MSTPTEPGDAERPDQPAPQPDDTQADQAATAAYPTDAAPTEAYPPVPPAPQAPAAPAGYGQAPYGQAPYGQNPGAQPQQYQTPYGQAPTSIAPAGPDTRPKTLGWFSVGLVGLGFVLVLLGFLPLAWVGLIAVLVGGLALIVAFILSIVVLASRKQGGKPLGIIALVVSVIGGGLWFVALVVALAVSFSSASSSAIEELGLGPTPSASVEPGDTDPDGGTETDPDAGATGDYDETAFIEEVRPQIVEVFQEIDPNITAETLDLMFPDETLVAAGQGFLLLGDSGREYLITTLVDSSEGVFTEESAARFADAIIDGAEKHLQQ